MDTHVCDAAVVCCIDFRFQKFISDWTQKELKDKMYDRISFAGSTKDLDTIMKQLSLSKDLHEIKEVFLIHHEDCGAYGEAGTKKKHAEDLHEAEERIMNEISDVDVKLYYLRLDGTFENI